MCMGRGAAGVEHMPSRLCLSSVLNKEQGGTENRFAREEAPCTRGQPSSPWASVFSSVSEGLLVSILLSGLKGLTCLMSSAPELPA